MFTTLNAGTQTKNQPRYNFKASSNNRKLIGMPVVSAPRQTCNPFCPWSGQCYAEREPLKGFWTRLSRGQQGRSYFQVVEMIKGLKLDQIWRYADIGDLPGRQGNIDTCMLSKMVLANRETKARAYTYTHKSLGSGKNRAFIRWCNRNGFTINLSAEGLPHADELADLNIGPVYCVLQPNAWNWEGLTTPSGRRVVQCRYYSHGKTCKECGLCAQAGRDFIVASEARGMTLSMWRC